MMNSQFMARSPNGLLWASLESFPNGFNLFSFVCGLPPAPCPSKLPYCSKCWCQLTIVCLVNNGCASDETCAEQLWET
jgi:hypothetical protein